MEYTICNLNIQGREQLKSDLLVLVWTEEIKLARQEMENGFKTGAFICSHGGAVGILGLGVRPN